MALSIITNEGRPATVSVETGKHGGPVLVVRDTATTTVLLGVKAEHATVAVLSTVLPLGSLGSVAVLLEEVGA